VLIASHLYSAHIKGFAGKKQGKSIIQLKKQAVTGAFCLDLVAARPCLCKTVNESAFHVDIYQKLFKQR